MSQNLYTLLVPKNCHKELSPAFKRNARYQWLTTSHRLSWNSSGSGAHIESCFWARTKIVAVHRHFPLPISTANSRPIEVRPSWHCRRWRHKWPLEQRREHRCPTGAPVLRERYHFERETPQWSTLDPTIPLRLSQESRLDRKPKTSEGFEPQGILGYF